MLQISIHVDASDVSGLGMLRQRLHDMRPVLLEIGEDMAEATKQRFASATGPDGQPWAPNSPVTLAHYGRHFKGGGKKAAARLANKKPLTGETGALARTINYQVSNPTQVQIGSPMVYAAVQQLGAQQGEFGRTSRNSPIPWGNIPARPFLGLSTSDEAHIIGLVRAYLAGQ